VFHNIHSNAGQQRSHPSAGHTAPTEKEKDMGRFADPQAAMKEHGDGR
jgi:hypothetical protein